MTAAQTALTLPSASPYGAGLDVRLLPLGLIAADPVQPRKDFDGPALGELAESIRVHGVLQPILVRPVPASRPASVPKDCDYLVIAGERRLRASHLAGLTEIPAQIRDDLNPDEIAVVQVLENLQRRDLSFAETARGVALLVDRIGNAEAAKQLGKPPSWVSRHAHVLALRKEVVALVTEGLIESVDVAHELHALFDLSQERGLRLVEEFRSPPNYRGTPPTRQMIRGAIDVEKQRIQSEKERAEEKARAQAQREILDVAEQYGGGIARAQERAGSEGLEQESNAGHPAAPPVAYRHPNDSRLTWTGRGRMPLWVVEWGQVHGSLDGIDVAKQQAANEQRRAQDKAEWKAAQDNLIALKAHATTVIERLRQRALQNLQIEARPRPDDESETDYWFLGREAKANYADTPVDVGADNLHHNAHVSAKTVEEIRYGLAIDFSDLSEREIEELVGRLGAATGQLAATTSPAGRQIRLVEQFLEETCEKVEGGAIKAASLHEAFVAWFGTEALTIQHFGNAMKLLGYSTHRHKTGVRYLDLQPKEAA